MLRWCLGALALPSHGMRLGAQTRTVPLMKSQLRTLRTGMAMSTIVSQEVSATEFDWLTHFELLKTEEVHERGLTASLFRHKITGAEVLSIDADDDNKVFSCNFRTLPKDNTGVPHILEHSVLCGSQKYPVKEPFVEMLKGSLKTFLNAMTAADKTMYPVASQNKQDFLNLANVYLDACFYPRILDPDKGPQILKQEGWHYEVSDPTAPLKYKGVVFNEMKGVYSSADQVHYRALKRALFRGHPIYAIDSGGDPTAIPALTYEDFVTFHRTYYHPANARLFMYGRERELPLSERLALLQEYLCSFEAPSFPDEEIPLQPLEIDPYEMVDEYPADASSKAEPAQFVSVAWLLNSEPLDAKTKLAFGVLNHLLLGTSASILEKTLMESKLGASVTGGGYSSSLQQATFAVGLKGVALGEVVKRKVVELILGTLRKCADDGFEDSAINASMNTVEFRLRSSSASPMKGLSFMMGAASEWNYGRDPIQPLYFEGALAELKADLADGKPIFQTLLEQYLLSNTHRLTHVLLPSAGLTARFEEEEIAKLAQIKLSMEKAHLHNLVEETATLKAAQAAHDAPEELAKLPTLTREDLERSSKPLPIEVHPLGTSTLLTHVLPADGIVYVDVALDLFRLPAEEVPLLPLFTRMLSELGTTSADEVAFSRKIGSQTGGMRVGFLTSRKPDGLAVSDHESMIAYLTLRGKSVCGKVDELLELATEMLTSTQLDAQSRVIEMLRESKIRMEASVVSGGNSYASSTISSQYSLAGYIHDLTGGLPQLTTIKQTLEQAENDWPTLLSRLERMREAIMTSDGAVVNLSADSDSLPIAMAAVPAMLSRLPARSLSAPAPWTRPTDALRTSSVGLAVSSQVNYVAQGCPIFMPGERVPGSASVITRYLRTAYLWDAVRVQGGAYGCSLGFSRISGVATYSSYRDPNVAATLNAYAGAADFLRNNPLTPSELTKAIIGTIGDLDSPQSVDGRGYTSMLRWLLGISEDHRQQWRDEVLATAPADFVAFAEKLEQVATGGSVAVVGAEKALLDANKALPPESQLLIRQALD